ncbi:hypothetical protein ACJJTC_015050 [Scirpophaga incertulas]
MVITGAKCDLPASKMDPTEPVFYTINIVKVNKQLQILTGNFNITRRYGPVFVDVRVYQYKNATKNLVFKLEHISCHNPFLYQCLKFSNTLHDNKCFFEPGYFVVKSLDLNKCKSLISKSFTTDGKLLRIVGPYIVGPLETKTPLKMQGADMFILDHRTGRWTNEEPAGRELRKTFNITHLRLRRSIKKKFDINKVMYTYFPPVNSVIKM